MRTTSNVVTDIYAFLFVWHMTKDSIKAADRKDNPDEYDDVVPDLPQKSSWQSPDSSVAGSMHWILGSSKQSLHSCHGN